MQRVERVEASGGIDAFFCRGVLALVRGTVSNVRLGNHARVEIVDVDRRGLGPEAAFLVEFFLTTACTHRQLMFAAKQAEWARERAIEVGLYIGGVVLAGGLGKPAALGCAQIAGERVGLGPDLGEGQPGGPVVVEAGGEVGEQADVVPIPIGPVVAQEC